MPFKEYPSFDALGLGELTRKGEVSPLELMDEAIARVEKHNPSINAVVYKFYDRAREAARTRKIGSTPFEGVPLLLKDILGDCEGVPTRFASRYVPEFPSPVDSEQVARFKRAGLIPFAKTNAPEFGLPPITEPQLYGPARNPWNVNHTPGGSSGGSAAAVAAGIVPIAHANDGGGSIRIPAGCCGLVGLKPTRGRVSLAPNIGDVMGGLVCEHVVARSVRDSAAALDATEGWVPGDPYAAPPKARPYLQEVTKPPRKLRIAFSTATLTGEPLHPKSVAAARNAAKLCAELGHEVCEDQPALGFAEIAPHFFAVYGAGLAANIELVQSLTGRAPGRDVLESMTLNMYELGRQVSGARYLNAVSALQHTSRQFAAFFENYDIWLTPTLGCPPLKVGQVDLTSPAATLMDPAIARLAHVCPVYNITGQPAISLPLHWTADGLPIGVMFGARFGDEGTLFQLAGQIEHAQPWSGRKPPVWG
ncbi:MAG TPA: amidase family protein [Candidatus Binataceae bacterium]|nr:amidase family protein [Candidatus Binataceae bacterium]